MAAQINLELLEAAKRGDSEAIGQILCVCQPDLQRYAKRYCVSTSDADDAVQDSLIVIFRKLPALRAPAAFGSWVFTIVRNACHRMAQRMFHNDVPLDEAIEGQYLAVRTDVELRLDIAMAIESLPDLYREVIVLRDFEGLTVKEIATRFAVSRETVKTRLHRGRKLIREYLLA